MSGTDLLAWLLSRQANRNFMKARSLAQCWAPLRRELTWYLSPEIIENTLRGVVDSMAFIAQPENKPAVLKSWLKDFDCLMLSKPWKVMRVCLLSTNAAFIRGSMACAT